MTRHAAMLFVGLLVMGGAVAAQQAQPAPAPAVPRSPVPPRTVQPRPSTAPAPPPDVDQSAADAARENARRRANAVDAGQAVNIRLEVSIIDQVGAAAVQPKVLTLLLADRSLSQLRSSFEARQISVDAQPTIVDNKVKLYLAISSARAGQTTENTLPWNQSLTVIVENGKPLVVVENSDPANNRKLSVEVKATILK